MISSTTKTNISCLTGQQLYNAVWAVNRDTTCAVANQSRAVLMEEYRQRYGAAAADTLSRELEAERNSYTQGVGR